MNQSMIYLFKIHGTTKAFILFSKSVLPSLTSCNLFKYLQINKQIKLVITYNRYKDTI